ncbi:MAG TPA: dihydrodipicolinate synthase family protein [Actinomycetota bacterium]|jgi:dihydrodipicolinate synthase/N-acetylneuraminate lyase|nr:dihydrodipicolinate synthase family protein [Actinomycetota bacterium]
MTELTFVAALFTPFGEDGGVDREALAGHVRFLFDKGIDAVMPCGTTGEGPLLDDEVVEEVVAATVEAAGGRTVIAHVGRPGTEATIRLARRAVVAGASAISAVVPYYYSLAPEQTLRHYRSLLEAVPDVPVFAYTIPDRTGNQLERETLEALAHDGLAGLKDSTKSFDRHLEYLAAAKGNDLRVLMGSDGMVLEALRAGAAGSVSALANLRPDLLVRLKRAFLEGREEEAERTQKEIAELRSSFSEGPTLSALKRAVAESLAEVGVKYPPMLRAPLG